MSRVFVQSFRIIDLAKSICKIPQIQVLNLKYKKKRLGPLICWFGSFGSPYYFLIQFGHPLILKKGSIWSLPLS